ncbi:hypothetical protein [Aeromonas rivipollensis]|uniref:hypothetical protein n=1 Tax=Aeromonas rivipollensis TaxID=948519 RepID=UPI0038D22E41
MITSFSGMAAKKGQDVAAVAQVEEGQGAELPLYQSSSGALPTLTPAAPAAPELPVLAYHGWQRYGKKIDLLLCQEGADGRCEVTLTWADVHHWKEEGGSIVVMGGPNGPDLWRITDRTLWVDALGQGIQLAQR